ncbi:peptide-methionine (R)-S-oxide reductase MsrB [Nesterenkonia sp. CL21]|uniref:peptide-methionine (R)-S-oxide reductase MsrB n=1 Tax=unclassified Nesterenkonia TaxID=2629769 RepID=UPI002878982C|nr:peptide-methionine (R)-S-oxide reductase MsrB [Nesterenkonia sp. CL21]MDS2171959.1 peptide-methionine (R)-S-oxide reductase MsrB [Nesterenkonia sp. CL21]
MSTDQTDPDARPPGTAPDFASLSDAQWRDRLTPEEYYVLRQGGTERPFTGDHGPTTQAGVYLCRACGAELFTSQTKFDSRCGWPSFYEPATGANVRHLRDTSLGMERVEVRCGSCDSHLGHVFSGEGFDTPTDQRYCINSVSMRFEEADE